MQQPSAGNEQVVILAHERFPEEAKTAVGILRYGDYDVVGILDRTTAGDRVRDHVSDVPDAPIVESFEQVPAEADALIIGIAPVGGGFDDRWRPEVRAALADGCDIIAGLHYVLSEDEEFANLAADAGSQIHDVRQPPADIPIARGRASSVDAHVVLTVGTDGSVGKMTTTVELVQAAQDRGIDAGFIPTGQTGIMIDGWGIAIDRVIADFVSGAVERMILERGDDHDVLFVEGQGSIVHPAYSADAVGILHGAMADQLVLVHDAARTRLSEYEAFPIPRPERYIELYESVAEAVRPTDVSAGALNTSSFDSNAAARDALAEYSEAIGAPATDVIRFDADELLDSLLPTD